MTTFNEAATAFLSHRKIAVVGVSRKKENAANLIYRKLRSEGYTVFAVNPNATTLEGDRCYPNLKSIPDKPECVVVVTRPEITSEVVRECAALKINGVWMHRGIDSKTASVSKEAIQFCKEHGIEVIPGGCPMMYINHADFGHRAMRWMQQISGSLPKVN